MSELFDGLGWNKRLEVLRTIKGWSQTEAAEKCNTTQKGYWTWESGTRFPHKNNRIAIARAFGVKETDIFGQARKEA